MKLVRLGLLVFVASFVGTTAAANDNVGRLRHVMSTNNNAVERELWKSKFQNITVTYDPTGGGGDGKDFPTCILTYMLDSQDGNYTEYKVVFEPSEIFHEDHKVKCQKKKYHPEGHVKLPVDIDVPNEHTTWVGEKVTDAKVKWGLTTWSQADAKRLDVVILREPSETVTAPSNSTVCPGQKVEWKAIYNFGGDPKCLLSYKVNKGSEVTIPFEIVFGGDKADSSAVKCVIHIDPPENKDTLCLPIIEEDITDYAYFVGKEVQSAEVNWKKDDGYLSLVIEADDPDPLAVRAKYIPHAINDPPCTFSYVVAGVIVTVEFEKDEVFESKHGDTVICKKKEHPKGGLKLPIQRDFPNMYATWVGETVRDFEVRWGDDNGNKQLEVLVKRTQTCPEIVEGVIYKASLKPKGFKSSTSPQSRALSWLKTVADCEHHTKYQWIHAYALATFYFASGGENWMSSDGWIPPFQAGVSDLSNVCKPQPWEFVTCDGNMVVALEPVNNNLVGVLTPEIGLLKHLETLNVKQNMLDGEIPEQLARLKDLEFLDLSFNYFSGSIAEGLCDIIVNRNNLIVDSTVHCPKGCCALGPGTSAPPSIAPTAEPSAQPSAGGPEYGLQPACDENDESAFNICLDLTSRDKTFQNWMNLMIAAAAEMEEVVIEDIPAYSSLAGRPASPPFLTEDCTGYPETIDDIYVCAQDRVYSSPFTIASAGPYIVRRTPGSNRYGFPIASVISISTRFVNDARLEGTLLHELHHAFGFPVLSTNFTLFEGRNYKEGTKADAAWKEIGCSGPIPMQASSRPGHWNEACLKDELMTPIRTGNRALSNITIGALEDLGYGVNYTVADEYTIDDLGKCSAANCPEAADTTGSPLPVYVPTESERVSIMEAVRDDLIYFHDQLKSKKCEEAEDDVSRCRVGYFALEQMDVLYIGGDGETHSLPVTYDDVKDM